MHQYATMSIEQANNNTRITSILRKHRYFIRICFYFEVKKLCIDVSEVNKNWIKPPSNEFAAFTYLVILLLLFEFVSDSICQANLLNHIFRIFVVQMERQWQQCLRRGDVCSFVWRRHKAGQLFSFPRWKFDLTSLL